jgi:hypothetical protein
MHNAMSAAFRLSQAIGDGDSASQSYGVWGWPQQVDSGCFWRCLGVAVDGTRTHDVTYHFTSRTLKKKVGYGRQNSSKKLQHHSFTPGLPRYY